MCRRITRSKAQTTLEYAILIGVIVAALIAMQTYIKRGFQGKMRGDADSMGAQFSPGHTKVHTHNFEDPAMSNDQTNLNGSSNTSFTNAHLRRKGVDSYEDISGLSAEEWFNQSD